MWCVWFCKNSNAKIKDVLNFSLSINEGRGNAVCTEKIHLAFWCFIMRLPKLGFVGAAPDTQPLTDWQTEKGIMGLLVDVLSCQYYVETLFCLIRPTLCWKKRETNKTLQCWRFMDFLKRCCKTSWTSSKWENCLTDGNISHVDEQKPAAVKCGVDEWVWQHIQLFWHKSC